MPRRRRRPAAVRHNCANGTTSLTRNDATGFTPWTLRAIYVAIGLSTASIAPFVPVILRARGLDPAVIGLVAALAALLTTVVVPVWGHLADVLVGRARAFRIGLIVAAGAAAGLLLQLVV